MASHWIEVVVELDTPVEYDMELERAIIDPLEQDEVLRFAGVEEGLVNDEFKAESLIINTATDQLTRSAFRKTVSAAQDALPGAFGGITNVYMTPQTPEQDDLKLVYNLNKPVRITHSQAAKAHNRIRDRTHWDNPQITAYTSVGLEPITPNTEADHEQYWVFGARDTLTRRDLKTVHAIMRRLFSGWGFGGIDDVIITTLADL